jgi:hypothetical protein
MECVSKLKLTYSFFMKMIYNCNKTENDLKCSFSVYNPIKKLVIIGFFRKC